MFMPILSHNQIRQWDDYTLKTRLLTSWQLMESAVISIRNWLTSRYDPEGHPIIILCGSGNNGGDGLGLARHLFKGFYDVTICQIAASQSPANQQNWDRLPHHEGLRICTTLDEIPGRLIHSDTIWIDALVGTGLQGPLRPLLATLIQSVNALPGIKISIDIPSGLLADESTTGTVFHAQTTLTFGTPKFTFFFSACAQFVGAWQVLDIGLDHTFLETSETSYFLQTATNIRSLLKHRGPFAHKGTMGHAGLICGSEGLMGAALLSGKAALRSGAGKLTIHAPNHARTIIQTGLPEALFQADPHEQIWSTPVAIHSFQAVGIGCGIGTNAMTCLALYRQLTASSPIPLVLDADAINILALHPEWLDLLPENTILTPHPGEFNRLTGQHQDEFHQLEAARQLACKHRLFIVLKGAWSRIISPDGRVIFNCTGNAGMATAGSGDVLTGLLTGLLAQGYPVDAAVQIGVYLHGLSGDLAVEKVGSQEAILASDLVESLGHAFHNLHADIS